MAELSGFWTTDGATPEGDQVASYTQAHWSTGGEILAACSGFEGVAPGYKNGLAGTVSGANTVAINTGGAVVDGKWFLNDASQDVNIPSSGGGTTRIDRIVLRATWATFNVSVTRIAGVESGGTPSAPAITQTSGTTYDIMLYKALVDSAGTVTLTDERVMASPLKARQGGSATVWSTAGTSNYIPSGWIMQVGSVSVTDDASVTFPVAFSQAPIVIPVPYSTLPRYATVNLVTASECHIYAWDGDGTSATVVVFWIAIGPP